MGDEPFNKLPTISSSGSAGKSTDRRRLKYATERARLLFGCYRRTDAADPDVYVTAVALVLADYSDELIREVTDPRSGIQATEEFGAFLPNAGEIKRYCEQLMGSPRYRAKGATADKFRGRTYRGRPVEDLRWRSKFDGKLHPLTEREIQQLLDREAWETAQHQRSTDPTRPSYDDLKAKYGKTFGIGAPPETPEQTNARWAGQVQSWDRIKEHYEQNPERWQALVREREDGLR